MRFPFPLLLCAVLPALAGGPCDVPGAAGHYIPQDGPGLAYCPAPHVAPQPVAAAGLPAAGGLNAVIELTTGAPEGRTLLAAHAHEGVYRSGDGGRHWTRVSGTGSGLEQTSQQAAVLVTAKTAWGGLDALVGMTGAANGGIYLSGDGGLHWTQLQPGFDPANLSLSSTVHAACAGCAVQYYSASYGGGLYTRTVPVNPPPAVTGWNFGNAAGACAAAAPGGPAAGGQPFALCGRNFQPGAVVQFGTTELRGCKGGAKRLSCPATPPGTGAVQPVVRNPDTRSGALPRDYVYAPVPAPAPAVTPPRP